MNIWIGITVKVDFQPLEVDERSPDWTGESGRKAMKVSAPIVIKGAVSPMARDSPMIAPVRMPPDGQAECDADDLPLVGAEA